MARGPKPKPTKLKLLQGTARPDRVNDKEPQPDQPRRPLACPHYIEGEARKEWRRLVKQLHAIGLATKIDRAALEQYVTLYARWLQAHENIKADGLTIKTKLGFEIVNPNISIANKATELMLKLAAEFGLTPSARTRLKIEKPQGAEDDTAARLFR